MAARFDIRILVAMFDERGERTRSHGVPRAIMQAQADALGLELVAPSASWADYERVFTETLTALKARGIADVVFGDIDLQPHREWEEKVCAAAGVRSHLPLWQENRQALAGEILTLGYQAVVVCTDDRWLARAGAGAATTAPSSPACPTASTCAARTASSTPRHRRPAVPPAGARPRRRRRQPLDPVRRAELHLPFRPSRFGAGFRLILR